MHLSPDHIVFWQIGWFKINATITYTWGLMGRAGNRVISRYAGSVERIGA